MDYKIFWSEEALHNLEDIIEYISITWSQREVDNFKSKLFNQIDLIEENPKLFPISTSQCRLRKAVLSKHTSIFYEVKGNFKFLAYIFVSYKNPGKLK